MVTFCFNRNLFLKLHVLTIGIILLTILGCKDLTTTDTQKKDFGNAAERIEFLTAYTGFDCVNRLKFLDSMVVRSVGLAFYYYVDDKHYEYTPMDAEIYILVKNGVTGSYYINNFQHVPYAHSEKHYADPESVKKNAFGDTLVVIPNATMPIDTYFDDTMPDLKTLFGMSNWRTSLVLSEILNGIPCWLKETPRHKRLLNRETIDSIVRFSISLPEKFDVFSEKPNSLRLFDLGDSRFLKSELDKITSNWAAREDAEITQIYTPSMQNFVTEALKNDSDYLVYSGRSALTIGSNCLVVALRPEYLTRSPKLRNKNFRMNLFFKPYAGQAMEYDVKLYDFCLVRRYESNSSCY